MRVQKRDGKGLEAVKFDAITNRIAELSNGLEVDPVKVAMTTIRSIYDCITTEELDRVSANVAESLATTHPDYSILAGRILVSNLHKTTPAKFSECMINLNKNVKIISDYHLQFIAENAATLDSMIIDKNDYLYTYFGYMIAEFSYLHKVRVVVLDQFGQPKLIDKNGNEVNRATLAKNRRGLPVVVNDKGRVISRVWEMTRDRVMDRPQYMHMRVAIMQNHQPGRPLDEVLRDIKESYELFSYQYVTHATPTLFNSCTIFPQLGSCFLLGTNDSIEGIMKTITDASLISKRAGGIGIWCHPIRSLGSTIKGTNGQSSGLPRQLKIYNEAARCWDQGGKRLGAFAMFLEPWHGDILRVLKMKLNQGAETERARDLFYAMWLPDLFMKRYAEGNETWSLFSHDTSPGLSDVYDGMEVCKHCNYCANSAFEKYVRPIISPAVGQREGCKHEYHEVDAFTILYEYYEDEALAVAIVNPAEIADAIFESQKQSGVPYVCQKDVINRESNQKGIGTIKSSNLCVEIMEYSSDTSYASCTLASINLKNFLVKTSAGYIFDLQKLHSVARLTLRNLDKVIDVNNYPVPECVDNAKNYRPVAMGIQGLADVFCLMRIPFLSPAARDLDMRIAETIYHAALTESCELARAKGPFVGFENSPAARGILQFDLWLANQRRIGGMTQSPLSGLYDWDALRKRIMTDGLRCSLHVAYMPTVSTSQLLGNNESFEPFAANIYVKTTIAGKFTVTNTHMIRHLIELGLWNESVKNEVIGANGSIQAVATIPADIKQIYLTVWEMKQIEIMKAAARRQAFIDQSQSLNIHVLNNSNVILRSILMAAHKLGLKTGSYYIRTQAAVKAMQTHTTGAAEIKPADDEIKCLDCCSG